MSFRCEACKTPQPPGTRPVTRPIAWRERWYNTRDGEVPGREISAEMRLCPPCAGDEPTGPGAASLVASAAPGV